jgi:hypothetical protein
VDRTFGQYGKPNTILEAYISWRDEMLLQEADSKADFATFLFGPIRKSLYAGYSRVKPQYRRYVKVEPAQDFREHRLEGLNRLRGMGYVGDHGEYPEMRRTGRDPATFVVDTYGGVYGITRQAMRNDDLGQLTKPIPREMGVEAARFIAEAVVALVESNPDAPDGEAFYSEGRGNETTDALSEDSLATAIGAMEDQEDDDGDLIVVTPQTLVVKSVRMQLIANRIINSQLTGTVLNYDADEGGAGTGTAVFDKGTINPLAGILPNDGVVRDPYFTDANDWYMFGNPNDGNPAFVAAFLDGQEMPFVGLKNPVVRQALGAGEDPYEFDVDILEYKSRLDFGVAAVDPRGTYRGVVT